MGVSHPVSRNFKTHFPNIWSKEEENPASPKCPAGSPYSVQLCNKHFRRIYSNSFYHILIKRIRDMNEELTKPELLRKLKQIAQTSLCLHRF